MTINVQAGLDTSTVVIGYVKEATWGVTPAAPLQLLRVTGESLGFTITNTTSNEISPDPDVRDTIQTDAEAAGGVNFELSYGSFDDLLAAALRSEWSANVLIGGTNQDSFTVEKKFGDNYLTYRGMVVNEASIDIQPGQIITGSFSFMGKDMVIGGTSAGTGSPTAATTTTPLNAVGNVGAIEIDGLPYGGFITQLGFTINNNLRSQKAVGSLGGVGIGFGERNISGTMNVMFKDRTLYETYLAGDEFSMSFPVTDGDGNSYEFEFPRCKFTEGTVAAGQKNEDIIANMSFQALKDSVAGAAMRITRTPAP